MFSKNQLVGAFVGLVFLTGCGGGGTTTAPVPAGASSAPVPGGTSQQPTSGTRLTFTIHRGSGRAHASARRKTAATSSKRSPKYFSPEALGLQITASAGASTVSKYYDISQQAMTGPGTYTGYTCSYVATDPNDSTYTCSIVIPIVGTTETISAVEVDQLPTGEVSGTGQGTGFPANSKTLAVAGTSVTTSPGTITNVNLSLNPVVGSFNDIYAEIDVSSAAGNNIAYDSSVEPNRIVLTANVASNGIIQTAGPYDIDGGCIYGFQFAPTPASSATPAPTSTVPGQPFVNALGTPTPITAQSSTSHLLVQSIPFFYAEEQTAPPVASYTSQTATYASSSYSDGCLYLGYSYDGANVATSAVSGPTPTTLTINDNQTGQYASTYTYPVSFVDVYPESNFSYTAGATNTVTGFDSSATANGMQVDPNSQCLTDNNTTGDFTFTPGAYNSATGSQPFTITVGTNQSGTTCTFDLEDTATGVVTPSVQISLNVLTLGHSRR